MIRPALAVLALVGCVGAYQMVRPRTIPVLYVPPPAQHIPLPKPRPKHHEPIVAIVRHPT